MSNHLRFDAEDDAVTRGLRELHAPPAAEAYWSGLQARIMARISEGDSAWWSELGRWTKPALVAAAMLVIAAGALVFRSRDEATQVAYEDVLAAPTPISVQGAARPASLQGVHGQREEVFRFLITY